MKETPLTSKHIALGAKMAEFAGYNMPISYSGIIDEHQAVRNKAGLFDVSHMGEFIIKGKDATALLQQVTSNDVSALAIGDVQYTYLPNMEGGIVDDLLIYRLDEDQCAAGEQAYMAVVNAGNIQKDWDWINSFNKGDATLSNISDRTALLALQGPRATDILQQLTDADIDSLPYYHFIKGSVAGIDNVIISATGYTGAGGYELYLDNGSVDKLWDALMEAGAAFGILPAGLGARDTLRLEMGFCLYGNDIDDTTSPLEAGLGWITKLKKGPFNGSSILTQQKKNGVVKKLTGFTMSDRRVPRHGYSILDDDGNIIGTVTSGTMSPTLDHPIGMGYVLADHAKPGNQVNIEINRKYFKANIVKVPFITQK